MNIKKFTCIIVALVFAFAATACVRPETPGGDPVSKTALQTRYDEYKSFDSSKYTAETAQAVSAALTAAKAVLDSESATQVQVDSALTNLNAAIGALVLKTVTGDPEDPDDPDDPGEPEEPDFDSNVVYDTSYSPSTFDKTTVTNTVTRLSNGVRMIRNDYTLTNGNAVAVYAVEVNLRLAAINAGATNPLALKTPYTHMTNWEAANSGKKVLAAANADFFGGSTPVNAFVKDGVIIKDGHNIGAGFDYTVTANDLPASAPMLFGVNGAKAQIAPIKQYEGDITTASVKESVVRGKLYYKADLGDGSYYAIRQNINAYEDCEDFLVHITDTTKTYQVRGGSIVFTLNSETGAIVTKTKLGSFSTSNLKPESGQELLIAHRDFVSFADIDKIAEGGSFKAVPGSEDGIWDGYATVLGARQALVINGAIPSTVALENSNGAKTAGVPRTAVGVKTQNHIAVLFVVEGLRYGSKGVATDTYGLNLTQLADFVRFYGCKDAANFDGGGSTQLIYRAGGADAQMAVRSSDYGVSTPLSSSRSVVNAFLITEK